jgi:hypothetical protein
VREINQSREAERDGARPGSGCHHRQRRRALRARTAGSVARAAAWTASLVTVHGVQQLLQPPRVPVQADCATHGCSIMKNNNCGSIADSWDLGDECSKQKHETQANSS